MAIALFSTINGQSFDGFDAGGWKTSSFDIGTKTSPVAKFTPFHLKITYPTTCVTQCGEFSKGGMPVVVFATAFAGQIDAYQYDNMITKVAAHGIVVVMIDAALGFAITVNYNLLGTQLQKVLAFARDTSTDGLLATLKTKRFRNTLYQDGNKVIFAGHSSGAHIMLANIKNNAVSAEDCNYVGGVVMLSPMDGQDPLGFGGDFVVVDGVKLPFSTPGLIIAGELDGDFGSIAQGVPCTPDDRGNMHFYKGWNGLIYYIEAKGMGTLDVLNEGADTIYTQACAASNSSQITDRSDYRNMVKGSIVSFIQGVILNSQNYVDKLQNTRDLVYPTVKLATTGAGRTFSCSFEETEVAVPFEIQLGLILFGFLFALTFLTGLYCFFRRMDDDTLHRYHPAEGIGYDQPASFQTKLEPEYGTPSGSLNPSNSFNLGGNSRTPSINV